MMQPKKTKYRKAHKGRIQGVAKGGFRLNYGAFGLKAMEPDRITARRYTRWLPVPLPSVGSQVALPVHAYRTRGGALTTHSTSPPKRGSAIICSKSNA